MADSEAAIANMALDCLADNTAVVQSLDDRGAQARACKRWYAHERDRMLRTFDKWGFANRRAYPTQLGGSTYDATHTYAEGDYVSFAPTSGALVNTPELISTFVYISLQPNNLGHSPDSSQTFWAQLSRAAWAYVFSLPSDYLKAQGLYPPGIRNPREEQKIPYELGDGEADDADGNDLGPGTLLYTDGGTPWDPGWTVGDPAVPVSIELMYTARVKNVKVFPEDFVEALALHLAAKVCIPLRKDAAEAKALYDRAVAAERIARATALRERQPDPPPVPRHIAARRTSGRRGSSGF